MAKTIKIEFTPAQMYALVEVIDMISAMSGTGDDGFDSSVKRSVKLLDRALNKAGYKRKHN